MKAFVMHWGAPIAITLEQSRKTVRFGVCGKMLAASLAALGVAGGSGPT